ncbi:potassium channel family protein [Legionella sp. W05-934-2]|uniref:potassium channel family protein n=1 Tax=Legionella sp. W05-934-2 TaxID=1198649 RepID=UPI00346190C5
MKHPHIIERLRFLFLFLVLVGYLLLNASQLSIANLQVAHYVFVILLLYSFWVISHEKRVIWLSIGFLGLIEISLLPGLSIYPTMTLKFFRDIVTTCLFALLFVSCVNFTLKDEKVNVTTLFGSLSAYLFLGLCWAYLFQALMYGNPDSFNGLPTDINDWDNDFIYYSFVTLTTVGYGDVVPNSPMAKTLSWMAACSGQAFLTILMAILVAKFVQFRFNNKEEN